MFTKTIAALITATVLAITSHAALAEVYLGGNLTRLDYSEDLSDFNVDDFEVALTTLSGKLGVQFHENFSAEIRAGIGIGDDSDTVSDVKAELSLDYLFGAYIRGGVQAGDRFYPYLIAGYTHGKATADIVGEGGMSDSDSDSDFSYGVGVDMKMTEKVSGNIEYMNYFDEGGAKYAGFAIGITVSF